MESGYRWIISKERLSNSPSRKCGYDTDKELRCRQQAANAIQNVGRRLNLTELCMNTAIVYMHRFYVFHSFTHFDQNAIVAASLFLAAKVETDRPRKLRDVVMAAQSCLHPELPALDTEESSKQIQDLELNENVLLGTLGFDIAIDHPHAHILRCCHINNANKDLAKKAYFMASNTLHLTTMCIQYKSTTVACFCIHLACKLFNMEMPLKNDSGKWFYSLDRSVTQELLDEMISDYLNIVDKCPSWLKRKICANQNIRGYHRGVYELNQKRAPVGDCRGDTSSASLQLPPSVKIHPDEYSRRKHQYGKMVQTNYRPLPAPLPRHSSSSTYGPPPANMHYGGLSASHSSGSQLADAAFQNPMSGSGGSAMSATPSWQASLGPPPPPPTPPQLRHADTSEAIFQTSNQRNCATSSSAPWMTNPTYDNEISFVNNYREKMYSKCQSGENYARKAVSGSSTGISDAFNRSASNDEYKIGLAVKLERPYKADKKTEPYKGDKFVSASIGKQPPSVPALALPLLPPPPPPPIISYQFKPSSTLYPDRTTPPPGDVEPILPTYMQISKKDKDHHESREQKKNPLAQPPTPPPPPAPVISCQSKPYSCFYPGKTTPPQLPDSPPREVMPALSMSSLQISQKYKEREKNSGKKKNKNKEKHRANPKDGERERHWGHSASKRISKDRIDLADKLKSSNSLNIGMISRDKDSSKTSSKKRERSSGEEDRRSHPTKHGKS